MMQAYCVIVVAKRLRARVTPISQAADALKCSHCSLSILAKPQLLSHSTLMCSSDNKTIRTPGDDPAPEQPQLDVVMNCQLLTQAIAEFTNALIAAASARRMAPVV